MNEIKEEKESSEKYKTFKIVDKRYVIKDKKLGVGSFA